MSALGFDVKNEAMLDALTSDITKSSEIEGLSDTDRYINAMMREERNNIYIC